MAQEAPKPEGPGGRLNFTDDVRLSRTVAESGRVPTPPSPPLGPLSPTPLAPQLRMSIAIYSCLAAWPHVTAPTAQPRGCPPERGVLPGGRAAVPGAGEQGTSGEPLGLAQALGAGGSGHPRGSVGSFGHPLLNNLPLAAGVEGARGHWGSLGRGHLGAPGRGCWGAPGRGCRRLQGLMR